MIQEKAWLAWILSVVAIVGCSTLLSAQSYPSGFSQVLITNGISNPTAMAFAPDGRIFVCEQGGKLRVIKDNTLLPDAFISLTVNSSGERGLIGIALDPDFISNQYIYLYYTVPGSPPHNRIARYTADGDRVLDNSYSLVLDLADLSSATNHNGGAMHFGPDGKLYVAIGDNANGAHAQNPDTYHGKFLRINKDGTVPAGNPFTDGSEVKKRVWSLGLRNPFTFHIQPGTGKIFLNDVGQVTWEEINDATEGGKNFGWPQAEGNSTNPDYANPVYFYAHGGGDGKGCAITGGTFFNPDQTNYPSQYLGKYFYQDYCNNWINYIDFSGNTVTRYAFATQTAGSGLGLSVGNDGNLFYLSRSAGAVYKVVYINSTSPTITQHPASLTVTEEETATFGVSAVGTTPLSYQWRKNGNDIQDATNATYVISNVQPSDAAEYSVLVTNSAGSALSNEATLTVTSVNDRPTAVITAPVEGALYVAGTTIDFAGTGTDIEEGDLPAEGFSWQIDFHHADHKHDQPALNGIKEGSFEVPDEGETSDDVFYRFILTVKDAEGLERKDSVDVHPRKSTITLVTEPAGLTVTLDGQPFESPISVVSVEGMKRTIATPRIQMIDDVSYEFAEWSHGGEGMQTIVTPEEDMTYTAIFSPILDADEGLPERNVMLYPNPVRREAGLNVLIRSAKEEHVRVQLVDFLSRRIITSDRTLHIGENIIQFNTANINAGLYGVVVELEGKRLTKKVMIVD